LIYIFLNKDLGLGVYEDMSFNDEDLSILSF